MEKNNINIQQIINSLTNLGITDIPEKSVNNADKALKNISPKADYIDRITEVLAQIGKGTAKGIFAFNIEAKKRSTMYTYLFEGITNLTKGELKFTDINETGEYDDYEEEITFKLNGVNMSFTAEDNDGWYDLDIISLLNDSLEGDKKLYFTNSIDSVIMFYAESTWANEFEAALGVELMDNADYIY